MIDHKVMKVLACILQSTHSLWRVKSPNGVAWSWLQAKINRPALFQR